MGKAEIIINNEIRTGSPIRLLFKDIIKKKKNGVYSSGDVYIGPFQDGENITIPF